MLVRADLGDAVRVDGLDRPRRRSQLGKACCDASIAAVAIGRWQSGWRLSPARERCVQIVLVPSLSASRRICTRIVFID